jgi:hypothetical protein
VGRLHDSRQNAPGVTERRTEVVVPGGGGWRGRVFPVGVCGWRGWVCKGDDDMVCSMREWWK